MAERYFNREQEDHMRYLASVPRSQRCPSGWHVTAQQRCDCKPPRICENCNVTHSDPSRCPWVI